MAKSISSTIKVFARAMNGITFPRNIFCDRAKKLHTSNDLFLPCALGRNCSESSSSTSQIQKKRSTTTSKRGNRPKPSSRFSTRPWRTQDHRFYPRVHPSTRCFCSWPWQQNATGITGRDTPRASSSASPANVFNKTSLWHEVSLIKSTCGCCRKYGRSKFKGLIQINLAV